jgi:hypothetical protein
MEGKTTHILRIHLGLFFAEAICVSAFVLELSRALSGNTLSWAYVVEWPVLGTYAIYMWRKLLKEERLSDARANAGATATAAVIDDDPRLAAWNDYLARVHSNDQSNQNESQ